MTTQLDNIDQRLAQLVSARIENTQEWALTTLDLERLTAYTRDAGLPRILAELIGILQNKGYYFSDILNFFGDYAYRKAVEGITEQHPTWKTVADLVGAAATIAEAKEIQNISMIDIEDLLEITSCSLKIAHIRTRKTKLIQPLTSLVGILYEQNYHFCNILKALASCALMQFSESSDAQPTWETVAAFLKAAATEAETRGRELP